MKAKLVCKILWSRIIETLYPKGVNKDSSWGWKFVDDDLHLRCCRLEKEWIADVITEEMLWNIRADTPTLIASQTGTGKTTWIFKRCLPVALARGKKILYLCNRISLAAQMKERCMQDVVNGEQLIGESKIRVRDMREYFLEKYINQTTQFGAIDVMTYQAFIYKNREINPSKYDFLILDEAHFFLSDANFNPFTEEIMDIIVKEFASVKRIYLTATPYECLDSIYAKEKEQMDIPFRRHEWDYRYYNNSMFNVFVMDEDYSYMRPWFFSDAKLILDKVKNSTVTDFWLIFVRDKNIGQEILTELENIEGGAVFFTADSDKNEEEYLELIKCEKLPKRVVISTKVLDVGLNVRTENLHLVVFEDNIVEMKQMVGRKRIKYNETLDVYFHIPSFNQLSKRMGQIEKKLNEEEKIVQNLKHFKNSYSLTLPHPLYYHEGIRVNALSMRKLWTDKSCYEHLLKQLEPYKEQCLGYQKKYAELLLENFTGTFLQEGMLLELKNTEKEFSEKEKKVISNMQNWIGKTISKTELDEQLLPAVEEIIGDCRTTKRADRGHMSKATANKELAKCGYEIESQYWNGRATTYQIKCIDKKEVD